uniref:Uncharacterized protein n=3 Tax=Sphaerodactylus townsendi TaxID=933632 RepID=A0ACB8G065_9SAUR
MGAPGRELQGGASSAGAIRLLLALGCYLRAALPYNLDTLSAQVYQGPDGALFGYSVLLHSHGPSRWLVVGAPKANWSTNSSVVNPGAIFKCQIGRNPKRDCDLFQVG